MIPGLLHEGRSQARNCNCLGKIGRVSPMSKPTIPSSLLRRIMEEAGMRSVASGGNGEGQACDWDRRTKSHDSAPSSTFGPRICINRKDAPAHDA